MNVSLLTLAALAAGCSRLPLPEAPIEGGSDDQRALVRAVLNDFDRDTGPGRVEIGGVQFEEADFDGVYDRLSGKISLHPSLALDELPMVLRHELCHALDFREGISDEVALWGEVSDDLFASGQLLLDPYRTDRLRRAEAFASFCGEGPYLADLLADSCPGDPSGVGPIARALRDQVWIEARPLMRSPAPVEEGRWPSPLAAETLAVTGTDVEGVVELQARAGAQLTERVIDLYTGAPTDSSASPLPADGPPEALPVGWPGEVPRSIVLAGEGFAAVDTIWTYHLGYVDRLLVDQGEGWSVAGSGCVAPVWSLFESADRPWIAWAEGTEVRWASLSEDGANRGIDRGVDVDQPWR